MDLDDKKRMLIEDLRGQGYLETPGVIKAFRDVPRELFVSPEDKTHAYIDQPLHIDHGQTISAPHMVAVMTELLELRKNDTVLEIGSGSGYQAAIISKLVKIVYTTELVPSLVSLAKRNLRKAGVRNVEVIQADGSLGWPEHSPYNRIIVTCGTDKLYPAWEKQLKDGGLLLAPVNAGHYQELITAKKNDGKLKERKVLQCSFVPLKHHY